MSKKADAWRDYQEAAMVDMLLDVLPKVTSLSHFLICIMDVHGPHYILTHTRLKISLKIYATHDDYRNTILPSFLVLLYALVLYQHIYAGL